MRKNCCKFRSILLQVSVLWKDTGDVSEDVEEHHKINLSMHYVILFLASGLLFASVVNDAW
jgi:hypothetical protein